MCFRARYGILYFVKKYGRIFRMQTLLSRLLINVIFWNDTVRSIYYGISFALIALMVVVSAASIVLVMLQSANSEGIDALGGSSETFYGKNKGKSIESKLKMWTFICLGILAVLAVVFFILQIGQIWGTPVGE